jgi:hypothetical protein
LAKNGKVAARAADDLRLYRIQVIDRAVGILNCFSLDIDQYSEEWQREVAPKLEERLQKALGK